jgi:carboxypeptidase PM20D1
MKKLFTSVFVACLCILSIVVLRALRMTPTQMELHPAPDIVLDGDGIVQRLAGALRFETVSHADQSRAHADQSRVNNEAFRAFHAYLEASFPKVHDALKREVIGDAALLYTWRGRDATAASILLMAHQDVVPVTPGTEQDWEHPPFAGETADGFIWGRGALDIKSGLMGILQAVEALLGVGFAPAQTVYLAFGHDEEVGGSRGAAKIADVLAARKVRLEYVLDEGGNIVQGIIPNVAAPVALVGIAEKGYVSLELSVERPGGHSSMPPRHTAVGVLSQAVTRLEAKRFPADLSFAAKMFDYLGPEMPFLSRMVVANLWLFRPLVENRLGRLPAMNATIRTTTAATMFNGSVKDNILPQRATAVVNFRIMPGESVQTVIAYVHRVIGSPEVQLRPVGYYGNPSPVSDTASGSYRTIEKTIRQITADPHLVVVPFLVVGATDSRYFVDMSDNTYHFLLNRLGPDDLSRIHGTNERISVENYLKMVKFYYQLLRNSNVR